MAFHGVLHESIGPLLFPWAPPLFGPLLWHGMGIAVLVLGLLAWAGTTHLMRFPVIPVACAIAALAIGVIVFFVVTHGQFHYFALSLAIAAATTVIGHRRALRDATC